MTLFDVAVAKKLAGGGGGGGEIPTVALTIQNLTSNELWLSDYFLAFSVVNEETGVIECIADESLPTIDANDSATFNVIASSNNHFILRIYGVEDTIRGIGDCLVEVDGTNVSVEIFGNCTIVFEVDG